jgi:hypothetical protein
MLCQPLAPPCLDFGRPGRERLTKPLQEEAKVMAEMGVFIGWGPPVRGREAKGLDVFNEAVAYWGRLQQDGQIESFEVVFLFPHGGDLAGFALLRGSGESLDRIRASDEFDRLVTRASLVVENFGVVSAALGDSLGPQLEIYQQAVGELT